MHAWLVLINSPADFLQAYVRLYFTLYSGGDPVGVLGSWVNFIRLFKGKVHQNVFDGLALPGTTGELTMLD